MAKIDVALVYDFDGTLSPKNMQEFSFIKALAMKPKDFWAKSMKLSKDNDASGILCYMKTMLDEAKYKGKSITKSAMHGYGKEIEFFPGVEKWFDCINAFGKTLGLNIKHYINSSGLKEMIEGTSIAKHFDQIFACSFLYDASNVAIWPGVAVDYTSKTQFLFKINKGIKDICDAKQINEFIPEDERPIPFKRMIYFGDGETDIPCMKLVKQNGGYSIAVYTGKKKNVAEKLIVDGRVNFVSKADYTENKDVYKIVKVILEKIKKDYDFDEMLKAHKRSASRLGKKQISAQTCSVEVKEDKTDIKQ